MLETQGGRCAICRRGGRVRHLTVDHDHQVERLHGVLQVSGLLCGRCNTALGKFEWSDEVLLRLTDYATRILHVRERYRELKEK